MMKLLIIVLGAAMLLSFMEPMMGVGHPPCWTRWFSSDNPDEPGDIELLVELTHQFKGDICHKPMKIQVETVDGVPANKTGQIFHLYSNTGGFICRNDQQGSGKCLDYKVRFQCQCNSKEHLY
ncbi:cartilage intermediate layer protein 1-like [Nothobranchius furzeri]|uniref:cartilage intermediate layer protein 1-like n=1 Tax=Nothobranchius furzeri TaxID=105023 RepID=UPI00390488F0